jgi:hypothetical protein
MKHYNEGHYGAFSTILPYSLSPFGTIRVYQHYAQDNDSTSVLYPGMTCPWNKLMATSDSNVQRCKKEFCYFQTCESAKRNYENILNNV